MLWNPETLPHYFRYDPATGHLYWKQKRRGRNCNKPAGSINKLTKCVIISCIGMQLFAHDIVWAYVTGKYSKAPIRHKNGNRWDNRFENLYEGMLDPDGTLFAPSLLSNGTIEKHLRYDKETGQLFWKEPRQGRSLKVPAGHFSSATGGRIVSINTFPFKAEYLIWLLENDGQKPLGTIRHRDGKKYNNRIENLYDDFFDFL